MADVFSYPNPVNEFAARGVAGLVVALTLAAIFVDQWWLLAILIYSFAAGVTTGPSLSPLAFISKRVLLPLMGNPAKRTPGPPKQFAQAIGLAFSVTALVLLLLVDSSVPYRAVLGVLAGFAFLESGVGFCAGCYMFGWLMKLGVIPASVCEECLRYEPAAA